MAVAPLLVLTGSPGCGKTTVAPLVADRHEPSVCLSLDWFFAALRRGAVEPWRAEAHGQNRTVLEAAAAAAVVFAAGGWVTVGEGIVYPFMMDLFADACATRRVPLHYAVLRAPIATVRRRVVDRRGEPEHAGALADTEVVHDLWSQFERHGTDERHRVDVGGLAPAAVVAEIDRRMSAGELLWGRPDPDAQPGGPAVAPR